MPDKNFTFVRQNLYGGFDGRDLIAIVDAD